MDKNNQIRLAVIADLTARLGDGFTYFEGRPVDISPDDELPAVAVYLESG